MKNHCLTIIRLCVSFTAMAIGLFMLSNPLLAQQNTPKNPSGREAYESARTRERNLRDREMSMQHIDDATKPQIKKEQMLALTQIKEDFERMQAVNNDLLRAVSKAQVLDYKHISEATKEINTRAKRLKTNLVFPELEEVKKEPPQQSSFD